MDWRERKELNKQKEKAMSEFFELVESSEYAKNLQRLCNSSANYSGADRRHEVYEVYEDEKDKNILQDLEDDLLQASVEFYTEFVSFFRKYNSESSRVHSAMGSKTSELKKKTSAENGKKGGRPRKAPGEARASDINRHLTINV